MDPRGPGGPCQGSPGGWGLVPSGRRGFLGGPGLVLGVRGFVPSSYPGKSNP
jgi:hypothetical protein